MCDEEILRQQFGNKNPFRVPEGFFDNFADQLMQQLPEAQMVEMPVIKRKPTKWLKLRPYAIAASFTVLIAAGATLLWNGNQQQANNAALAAYPTAQQSEDYTIDQLADYAMLDNQDLYSYLADL